MKDTELFLNIWFASYFPTIENQSTLVASETLLLYKNLNSSTVIQKQRKQLKLSFYICYMRAPNHEFEYKCCISQSTTTGRL